MNPRAAINDLLPFQGSPFSLLGISPNVSTSDIIVFNVVFCQGVFFSNLLIYQFAIISPFLQDKQTKKTERISYAPPKTIFIFLFLSVSEP